MQGRLVQNIGAWELARVVSGDRGAESGVGLEWRKEERHDLESNVGVEQEGGGVFSQHSTASRDDAEIAVASATRKSLDAKDNAAGTRMGTFLALAFDGFFSYCPTHLLCANVFPFFLARTHARTHACTHAHTHTRTLNTRAYLCISVTECSNAQVRAPGGVATSFPWL